MKHFLAITRNKRPTTSSGTAIRIGIKVGDGNGTDIAESNSTSPSDGTTEVLVVVAWVGRVGTSLQTPR